MPRAVRKFGLVGGAIALCFLAGAASIAPKPDTSLIVSTDWLARNLNDRSVVVLVVDRTDSAYRAGHVPGARFVPYATFGETVNGILLELPSPDSLRSLFESVGVSNASHVVLTGRPLIVTRAFYTLFTSEARRMYPALRRRVHQVETRKRVRLKPLRPGWRSGNIAPAPHPEIVAKAQWVLDRVGKPGYSFIDTRTDSEYLGLTTRGGLRSVGHLDGARRLEWQTAFTDSTEFSPKSIKELATLWRERVVPGDTVVAYCYIGYRAKRITLLHSTPARAIPRSFRDGSYDRAGPS